MGFLFFVALLVVDGLLESFLNPNQDEYIRFLRAEHVPVDVKQKSPFELMPFRAY